MAFAIAFLVGKCDNHNEFHDKKDVQAGTK
jgi:hypothetical protein